MISRTLFGAALTLLFAITAFGQWSDELAKPVRLEAGGKPVDTEVGHAAPFVCDFDGDGLQDLLVGQFRDGILWIYRNVGSKTKPELAERTEFEGGRVPSG